MNVHRYPDAYDGVAAAAPAIHWVETFLNTFWGASYMDVNISQFKTAGGKIIIYHGQVCRALY
jgi:hypothetical protein